MIGTLRFFLVIVAAAVPPAFFMCCIASTAIAGNLRRGSFVLAATFVSSLFLFLVGTVLLMMVVAWRRHVRRWWCTLLGAVMVLILPLMSLEIVINGAPMIFPDMADTYRAVQAPIGAALLAGLFGQPYGWFAGWIVLRLLFPAAAARDAGRFTRAWSDLRRGRFFVSLSLLPLLPAVALACAMYFGASENDRFSGAFLIAMVAALGAGIVLAIFGGAAFLYASSRYRQGRVSLASCLTLASILALGLPFAANIAWLFIGIVFDAAADPSPLSTLADGLVLSLTAGALFTPLGLPGGWLQWKIGVAPAPRPLPLDNLAATFD